MENMQPLSRGIPARHSFLMVIPVFSSVIENCLHHLNKRLRLRKMNSPHAVACSRRLECGTVLVSFFAWGAFAAEPDPRMMAPRNAVNGKLPSAAPLPAREAAKTFRVLDGFHMELLAAE